MPPDGGPPRGACCEAANLEGCSGSCAVCSGSPGGAAGGGGLGGCCQGGGADRPGPAPTPRELPTRLIPPRGNGGTLVAARRWQGDFTSGDVSFPAPARTMLTESSPASDDEKSMVEKLEASIEELASCSNSNGFPPPSASPCSTPRCSEAAASVPPT